MASRDFVSYITKVGGNQTWRKGRVKKVLEEGTNRFAVRKYSRVSNTQQEIEDRLRRLELLRNELRDRTDLSEEQSSTRATFEAELDAIHQELRKRKSELKSCYGKNSTSYAFAVALMFISFFVYGLYLMIYGHGK